MLRWFHKLRPPSERQARSADVPLIDALLDFMVGQISAPERATSILDSVSRFRKLPSVEQEQELPATYLLLEQFLFEVEQHKNLSRQSLRQTIQAQFAPLLAIPQFALIFQDVGRQEILLCQHLLAEVFQQAVVIIGSTENHWLEASILWISQLPDEVNQLPPFEITANLPQTNQAWIDLLCKLARECYARLEKTLGEELAGVIFEKSYQTSINSFRNLETFPVVIGLLPEKLLDEAKIRLLSQRQVQQVLIDKVNQLQNINEELLSKNRALEEAEKERQHFTNQLRTAADVSRQLNAILNPDQLLSEIVTLLQARFDLYHVHIYIINDTAETLVMKVGSGEAGRIMREQGHDIPLNRRHSLVARAAREGKIVVVDDVRDEADFMPNPLLTETRAEVAIPLVGQDKILGVLDIQEDRANCFRPSDLDTFRILAGQITTALENARLFEESLQTTERLREMDRLKSEFLANMSHELRTPLNSILGYSEMMLMGISGELPNEISEDVRAIYDNGKHLLSLISDVLDLAKIEAGHMSLSLEPVPVALIVSDIHSKSAGLFANKPVEMTLDIEEDLPAIEVDEVRIHQVINNLISNAAKFTDEGFVKLRAYRDNDWVCIAVSDSGIGISEADIEAIFEKFRQVDGSYTRRAEGTGLGLAITKHLVQMHGGQIDVYSQLGQGTTFTVRLPLQPGNNKNPDQDVTNTSFRPTIPTANRGIP